MSKKIEAPMRDGDAGSIRPVDGCAGSAPRRPLALVLAPFLIFAAVAGLFVFALFWKGDPSKVRSALIGKSAPSVALGSLDGTGAEGAPIASIKPGDLAAGTPVVINFWASWCQPCVDEHPVLTELKRRTGVRLFGINYKDQAPNARRFLARYGNPFDAVGADPAGQGAIEWGVYGMPETFVLDGAGIIVYKHVGPINAEAMEQLLIPAIEAARRRLPAHQSTK